MVALLPLRPRFDSAQPSVDGIEPLFEQLHPSSRRAHSDVLLSTRADMA